MKILFLGPPCPAIENALAELKHEVLQTEGGFTVSWLQANAIEFGISYRYKRIIKKNAIDFFQGRLINLHISYLPWNRGYDPNLWSYLEETPRGVTIHRIDEGIDTGDILLQKQVEIDTTKDTLATSYDKLSREMERLFIENVGDLLDGGIEARPQRGAGSFHLAKDKTPFMELLKEKGWDTPVSALLGRARKTR
ncbi:formyltransferase family protein [Desulfovibrio mangrovi]|uniref:formyltransferase family protein n=1 Tax=Desulfovibrio mangrovi TaxID=2976983 RepID=UPI00224676E6|nr:formyltransferase family protein [Desulfovibrio mangrovi]UZP66803.1 formyltransferase family protein [Desulfovibrio mangrovi]